MKYSLTQLIELSGVSGRTIRYYIQQGLLPAAHGERRGAWYSNPHLEALLRIRGWQNAGLSLDAIADLLNARSEPPVLPRRPGSIAVRSHLFLTEGVELVVDPERAGLDQSQLRRFFQAALASLEEVRAQAEATDSTEESP